MSPLGHQGPGSAFSPRRGLRPLVKGRALPNPVTWPALHGAGEQRGSVPPVSWGGEAELSGLVQVTARSGAHSSGRCVWSGAYCRHLQPGAQGLGLPHLGRAWRTQVAHNQQFRCPRGHASPVVPEEPGPMSPACLSGPRRPVLASLCGRRFCLPGGVSSAVLPSLSGRRTEGQKWWLIGAFHANDLESAWSQSGSFLGAGSSLAWVLPAPQLSRSSQGDLRVPWGSPGPSPSSLWPGCRPATFTAGTISVVCCSPSPLHGMPAPLADDRGPRLSPGSPLLLLAHVLPSTSHLDTVPDHVSSFPRSVRELLGALVFAVRAAVAGTFPSGPSASDDLTWPHPMHRWKTSALTGGEPERLVPRIWGFPPAHHNP